MKEKRRAILKLKKSLKRDCIAYKGQIDCGMKKYDEKKECIYLVLEDKVLQEISLDAIYECKIEGTKQEVVVLGRIKERYIGEDGNTVCLHIESGFYKNSINSVDKQ